MNDVPACAGLHWLRGKVAFAYGEPMQKGEA